MRSDSTHFRSCSLASDNLYTGGGVIIFVRQGQFFPELSISLLDFFSDYVGVNVSLKNSSSLSKRLHSSYEDTQ